MSLKSFRIDELEAATHTIQLEVFSTVKEVMTSPNHTILIDMYGFMF